MKNMKAQKVFFSVLFAGTVLVSSPWSVRADFGYGDLLGSASKLVGGGSDYGGLLQSLGSSLQSGNWSSLTLDTLGGALKTSGVDVSSFGGAIKDPNIQKALSGAVGDALKSGGDMNAIKTTLTDALAKSGGDAANKLLAGGTGVSALDKVASSIALQNVMNQGSLNGVGAGVLGAVKGELADLIAKYGVGGKTPDAAKLSKGIADTLNSFGLGKNAQAVTNLVNNAQFSLGDNYLDPLESGMIATGDGLASNRNVVPGMDIAFNQASFRTFNPPTTAARAPQISRNAIIMPGPETTVDGIMKSPIAASNRIAGLDSLTSIQGVGMAATDPAVSNIVNQVVVESNLKTANMFQADANFFAELAQTPEIEREVSGAYLGCLKQYMAPPNPADAKQYADARLLCTTDITDPTARTSLGVMGFRAAHNYRWDQDADKAPDSISVLSFLFQKEAELKLMGDPYLMNARKNFAARVGNVVKNISQPTGSPIREVTIERIEGSMSDQETRISQIRENYYALFDISRDFCKSIRTLAAANDTNQPGSLLGRGASEIKQISGGYWKAPEIGPLLRKLSFKGFDFKPEYALGFYRYLALRQTESSVFQCSLLDRESASFAYKFEKMLTTDERVAARDIRVEQSLAYELAEQIAAGQLYAELLADHVLVDRMVPADEVKLRSTVKAMIEAAAGVQGQTVKEAYDQNHMMLSSSIRQLTEVAKSSFAGIKTNRKPGQANETCRLGMNC